MAAFVAFIGTLLLSFVAALIAALQLGDFFGAGDEFLLVIGWLAGFAVVALVVLAIGSRFAPSLRALNILAFVLALFALVPPFFPGFVRGIAERSTNPGLGAGLTYIRLELLVPALIAVLVQWALVRSRWLRSTGGEELTLWPWLTTVIAGLVILNPFGLALLTDAFKRSPADPMWPTTAIITGGALAALFVMAWVECYIRDRMLDRRLAAGRDSGQDRQPG